MPNARLDAITMAAPINEGCIPETCSPVSIGPRRTQRNVSNSLPF